MEKNLAYIGANVDRLAALEIRDQREDQGLIDVFYRAAVDRLGGRLTMLAAQRLVAAVSKGDTLVITTGAGSLPVLPRGETDGPLGAVALARALRYGLGVVPVILCEADFVEAIGAVCVAGGLSVRDYATARITPYSAVIEAFPSDESAAAAASEIMSRMAPKALVSIEKLGPNRAGVAHNSAGKAAAESRSRVEHLFQLASRHGLLTIGIGDNGNEIGFGLIEDTVRRQKQYGDVCQCPCGSGLACSVATDVLIVSGTSNWGAYGLVACLAAVLGQPDLIHDSGTESRMLQEYVRMGGADATTATPAPRVDGTPAEVQTAILELMRNVVQIGLLPPRKKLT